MKAGKISNGVYFKSPSTYLVQEILGLFTFDNPLYVSASIFSPYSVVSAKIPRHICHAAYDDLTGVLRAPRGLDVTQLSPKARKEIDAYDFKDCRKTSKTDFPLLKVVPNKEQAEMLAAFNTYRKNGDRPFGNYLFFASTSLGKTILQALVAAKTGQRTLVVCLTNLIRDAWWRDLYTAFGIAKRNVGLIQQATWRVGEHFTLASAATLDRREKRWHELSETFGTIVVDEAHILSEPRMERFVSAVQSKYIIGATATGNKENGVNHSLYSHLGQPVCEIKTKNIDTLTSMALRKVRVVKTSFRYSYDPHNMDMHDMSISLAADDERNELIVSNAYADWKAGRSVVIAVKRVPHIHILHEMLRERGVSDANVLYGGTNHKKSYTEKLVAAFNERKTRMIVANYQSIKLGGNMNPLNSLHVAWPLNSMDLEQLIGRVRRKAAGKSDSELVYYLDTNVEWLHKRYYAKAVPVFREMGIEGFRNMF